MVLTPWIRKVKSKASRNRRVEDGFLLSEGEFRAEVTRERIRADRNRSQLSILAIELPADRSHRRDFIKLSRLLRRRLRLTDSAGYLANGRSRRCCRKRRKRAVESRQRHLRRLPSRSRATEL